MLAIEDKEALEGLSGKQALALAALIEGATLTEAAKAAGVAQTTVTRWLQDPNFKALYRESKRAALNAASGVLQGAMLDAVDTLKRNLHCGVPGVESRTALGLIDRAYKGAEYTDIVEAIDALEADEDEG